MLWLVAFVNCKAEFSGGSLWLVAFTLWWLIKPAQMTIQSKETNALYDIYRNSYSFTRYCCTSMGVRRDFCGGQRRNFAYPLQVADDSMQMDVHKTLYSFYTIEKMLHVTATVTKIRFIGSSSQIYCDYLYKMLSADFRSRVLLFKALPVSLTKPHIMTLFYLSRLVGVA